MFPWDDLPADSASPSKNFITTYQSDFRPMKDHQPWPRTRPAVRPAPGFSGSRQSKSEPWPVFFQHFYKTTEGSSSSSQNPTLIKASVQEAGVAMETGLSFGAGNRVNTSQQQQPEVGVQYQEGVILLWPNADPFSCDEVRRVLGQEAGPPFLPVVSGPFKRPDAETWQNHLSPVRTFNLWERTPERPAGYIEAQDVPLRISQPPVCGQQRRSWTRPDRKLRLTEYQARFGAQVKTSMTQLVFPPSGSKLGPSCNMNLNPSI